MDLRRLLLRGLLGMLALAAGAGVLAVFMSRDVMGRVAGTAVLTAIACGLAMPLSRKLEDESRRRGGLAGLTGIVAGFISAAAAIWVDVFGRSWDVSWRLALTAVIFVVSASIIGALLNRAKKGPGLVAACVGTGVVSASSLLLVAAVWSRLNGLMDYEIEERLAVSGWWVLGAGGPLALCLIGAGAADRAWRWLGVIASLIALGASLLGVWVLEPKDPTLFIVIYAIAVTCAYANVALRVPMGSAGVWARIVAIGSTAAMGLCIVALSYTSDGFKRHADDTLARVTGAVGIIALCSTLAIVILYWLNRKVVTVGKDVAAMVAVNVACPHCGRKFVAAVGASGCDGCGLIFELKLREPRCATCDYSLLGIKGGVCPECGQKS